MSVTLHGESQPSSDRVNDFGCRPQAKERRTGPTGYPLALSKAAWRATSWKTLHPPLPGSVTGAVHAARCRQISTAPGEPGISRPSPAPRHLGKVPDPLGAGDRNVGSPPLVLGHTGGCDTAALPDRCQPWRGAGPRRPRTRSEGFRSKPPLASAPGLRSRPVQRNATKPESAPSLTSSIHQNPYHANLARGHVLWVDSHWPDRCYGSRRAPNCGIVPY